MTTESKTLATSCPECGVDLRSRDRRAHGLKHWPDEPFKKGVLSKEAVARLKALDPERADEYIRKNG